VAVPRRRLVICTQAGTDRVGESCRGPAPAGLGELGKGSNPRGDSSNATG
jgi:hypothetical protein